MTIMDYQLAVLLAPTLGLVIYAVIDHFKHKEVA